jgi:hypothetical protein
VEYQIASKSVYSLARICSKSCKMTYSRYGVASYLMYSVGMQDNSLLVEVRNATIGLGFHMETWPETRHVVCRFGNRSVRVIWRKGNRPGLAGLLATVIASFLLPT